MVEQLSDGDGLGQQARKEFVDPLIELQLSLVDELQHHRRDHRLGDACNAHRIIGTRRLGAITLDESCRSRPGILAVAHLRDSGDGPGRYQRVQSRLDVVGPDVPTRRRRSGRLHG